MKKRKLTPTGKKIVKRLVDMDKTKTWLCQEVGLSNAYLSHILYGEKSGQKYLSRIFQTLNLQENEQKTG